MSADARPISPTHFAAALVDLPLEVLHAKAAELRNSLAHLKASNAAMLPFAEAGDQDCKDAMFENLGVIGRMNQRIELLRIEVVEKRGLPWPGDGGDEGQQRGGGGGRVNGVVNGDGQPVGGSAAASERESGTASSGRLTDDELRRRLEAQLWDGDAEEDGDGVHL